MRIPRPQLNYANVIATIALFVALGGAAVAAGLPKNSVGTTQLKPGAVTTSDLRRNAVTSGKIRRLAVTAGKLGPNAVLPGNLGNGIISTAKLADSAVIASKIRNGVVTTNKLDNGAVATAKLGDKAVTTAKLNDDAVTSGKLADGAVTPSKLAPGVIGQLLGTLKSGETLRGVFNVGAGGTKTEVADEAREAVSFQFPLLNPPAVTVLEPGQTTANCTGLGGGNAQTPQATGGNLCLYITSSANLETPNPLAVENTRLGFGLLAKAKEAGKPFFAFGQWAVTAP